MGNIFFTPRKALVVVVFHRVANLNGYLIRRRSFLVQLLSKVVPRLPINGSGIQIFGSW